MAEQNVGRQRYGGSHVLGISKLAALNLSAAQPGLSSGAASRMFGPRFFLTLGRRPGWNPSRAAVLDRCLSIGPQVNDVVKVALPGFIAVLGSRSFPSKGNSTGHDTLS